MEQPMQSLSAEKILVVWEAGRHQRERAAEIARQRGIEDVYRTVLNVGPGAGQSVFHLHVHLLGGRDLRWPPG